MIKIGKIYTYSPDPFWNLFAKTNNLARLAGLKRGDAVKVLTVRPSGMCCIETETGKFVNLIASDSLIEMIQG